MNGRIYDPLLGRMLSADLVVSNPSSLQDYNRYSYVRNNPLTFTDPSGFAPVGAAAATTELPTAEEVAAAMRALQGPTPSAGGGGNAGAALIPLLSAMSYSSLVDTEARDFGNRFAVAAFRDGAITRDQVTAIQGTVQKIPLGPVGMAQGGAEMVKLKVATVVSGEIGNAVAARMEGAGVQPGQGSTVETKKQDSDVAVHRIGGTSNMELSERDKQGPKWGLSVLLGGNPQSAANQMRQAFPAATGLLQASNVTAASTIGAIQNAGYTTVLDPSRKLPNHAVIQHPQGVAGFETNLAKLIAVFRNSLTPPPPPPPPPSPELPKPAGK